MRVTCGVTVGTSLCGFSACLFNWKNVDLTTSCGLCVLLPYLDTSCGTISSYLVLVGTLKQTRVDANTLRVTLFGITVLPARVASLE